MATTHRMDLLLAKEDPSEGRKVSCQTKRERLLLGIVFFVLHPITFSRQRKLVTEIFVIPNPVI